MPDRYPGRAPAIWSDADGLPHDENPRVPDVISQFGRLRTLPEHFSVRDAGLIPGRKYTKSNFGHNRAKNHFQGMQRLAPPHDDHLVVSGGDAEASAAQLFVFRLGSRLRNRPWGTNLRFSRTPPARDALVAIYAVDRTYWHAGGLQLLGDILAVPLEDVESGRSRIVFLDLTDPRNPLQFPPPCVIERSRNDGKAGAVALTSLPNQHYLCAVWSDDDPFPVRLDFYLSRSPRFADGFDPAYCRWPFSKALPVGLPTPKYQCVNFVTQTDGALFLAATENLSDTAPLGDGDDVADLYRLDFPRHTTMTAPPVLDEPAVTRIARRVMRCTERYGNFDAAAGFSIERRWRGGGLLPEGFLSLHAGYHWRIRGCLRCAEFRQDLAATTPVIQDIEEGWIDLFEEPGFLGRRLSILGTRDARIPDYRKIFVQDRSFGDTVSSVRFQLPAGTTYRLYRDHGFAPATRDLINLRGTGSVIEIPDLAATEQVGEETSSSDYA